MARTTCQPIQEETQTDNPFGEKDMLLPYLPHIKRGVCSTDVYNKGYSLCEPIAEAFSTSKEEINQMCNNLTQASLDAGLSVRFDWFFQGGHPMILYLGDYDDAVRTCGANVEVIRACLPVTVDEYMLRTGKPLPFNALGLITMGQALNGHQDVKSTQ